MVQTIQFWNRSTQRFETEIVQGARFLKWSFETRLGRLCLNRVFSTRFFSRATYGVTVDSRWSSTRVDAFVQKFKIPMEDFEETSYSSFNEFFIRKFKPKARSFASEPHLMPAFAEGKYLGFVNSAQMSFPVKGNQVRIEEILRNDCLANEFRGGPILICRLRPTDYHRFHFPDSGRIEKRYRVHGSLHATNPVCYHYKSDVWLVNERQISILETENFGRLAYVEVGAMCVGRICQTFPGDRCFDRGDEKGYFLVGGSTVIVLGWPNRWSPAEDILKNSRQNSETQIQLGEVVAQR